MPLEVAPEFENMLNGWLSRGKEKPLLLSLTGFSVAHPGIIHIQAPHLRELELPSPFYLPLLSLTESFPSLESLRVERGNCVDNASLLLNVVQIMQSAPHLTYLRFDVDPASRCLPEIEHCVRHTRLTSFRLKRTRNPGCAAGLFSFFACSSPPLETLSFDTIEVRWDSDDKVERCFSFIPSLTTLHLTDLEEVQAVLITLARDEILPNLASLTITRTSWQSPDAAWYRSLTNMLSLRRKTLRSFRLKLPQHRYSSSTTGPEEDVFFAPRAEGMDIYTNSAKEMSHGFFDANSKIARDGRIFSGDFE
ncbi:hypothetical protein DFH08DRAFT_956129 [Mycena albidolilacea]|uniref:Uncharacterized protein n=1 Tax=Mycena albidolilacea TaxID=1033008 RepID=A0AAD7A9U1_9AGAR|nr:hypothetical protein DFH08DRAFT_956129 [Mycena albidolilacea]